MMKRVTRVMIPVALLALAACGGGTHDSSAPSGGTPGGGASGGGSGGGGTTTPPAATAPSISTQPIAQNVTAPAAATFVVAASGTDPLSFQWRSSVNGTDWTNISGATSASYDTGATDSGLNGRYYSVVVSNSAGSVISASVQLTVASSPSGGGGGGSGGTPPSSGSLQPLTGTADPFPHTVAPLLASALAAGSMQNQGIISWDPSASGFNLGLTHFSGAQTRLFLPGGVFRDEVFLRLTEITGIGPQVTSVLAAVRIEPGDLLAEKTIIATFTIPDAVMATVDLSQMIGFAADNDGSNLHLMPIVTGTLGTQASRPGIKLGHLGIVGIAVATPQQQAALAAAWPDDPSDQLDAAIAPEVTANWRKSVQPLATSSSARTVKILAADSPDESPLLAPLRGYFNDAVVPAFAAAYGDPTLIPAAIQTGFNFIRNAQLSGLAETDAPLAGVVADLSARIDSLLDTYADYVAEQCRAVGGPPQLQAMLGTLRTLMLMGHESKADEIDDVLSQCSHFKATFKHDFTRTGHGVTGGVAIDETMHTVVEASTTFGFNEADMLSPMRLTTAELDRTQPYGTGGTIHSTWRPDPYTSTWGVHSLSVPILRTKGAAASTSVVLTLNGFNGFPFQATETTVTPAGTSETPGVTVAIPFSVPALPKIDGTPANYGPMLIPASGSVTSESTRTVPYDGSGSATEHQRVEVTLMRDE